MPNQQLNIKNSIFPEGSGLIISGLVQKYGLEEIEKKVIQKIKEMEIVSPPILKEYDGENLPFSDDFFNVIYSCFVIQHLSREHANKLIKESTRTLKPNGSILFEFFGDPEYYNNGIDVYSGDPDNGGMYNNAFVKKELEFFCGHKIKFIQEQPITAKWSNFWVCLTK